MVRRRLVEEVVPSEIRPNWFVRGYRGQVGPRKCWWGRYYGNEEDTESQSPDLPWYVLLHHWFLITVLAFAREKWTT